MKKVLLALLSALPLSFVLSSCAVSHHGSENPVDPTKDIRMMSNGVLYYKDKTLMNLTGVDYIDSNTGVTVGPTEYDFSRDRTTLEY